MIVSSRSSSPTDIGQIFEPIRDDLETVERQFAHHIESRVELIPEIGRYLQSSGGKRVRPAVLLMCARLGGYRGEVATLYASVVEFIHTATLVHDDIIDDSVVRRGRQSVHSRWGNDITVLLGDYLYIKSMGMALSVDSLDLVRLLCDVTRRMIEGELYQLTKTGDVDITEDEHLEIIRRKTAYLFGGCAQIGGVLGELSEERQLALRDYGLNLGTAFQLVDDILDFTADEAVLGKPVGGDVREGKMTLPAIYLLEQDGSRARDLFTAIMRDRTITSESWRELRALMTEHRVLDRAFERAAGFAEAAKRHLSQFPQTAELEALVALPDYVLSRDR